MTAVPRVLAGLCDDAAVFPPGRKPLPRAVVDHHRHRAAPYRRLIGPLVIPVDDLVEVGRLTDASIEVAVTAPGGPAALTPAERPPIRVAVTAVEVAIPTGTTVPDAFAALDRLDLGTATVHVEIPRDDRRADTVAACRDTGLRAKFRTGGVTADLYPDCAELAAGIALAVEADVPFKATAGLHHAVRNTDPETGFDQHGFLNILVAAEAARSGADVDALAAILADRDGDRLAAAVAGWSPERETMARTTFVSFGTCDVVDPLTELVALGLADASLLEGLDR